MNKISTSLVAGALAAVSGLSSCNKLTQGFDTNPNAASDAPATLQLTAGQLAEGFFMSGEIARTTNIWSGVFRGADRQYSALQSYITTTQDYDNSWTQAYASSLTQLRIVEDKANQVGNKQLLGIAQCSEALMIGTVTSLWGDVPYSQAFVADTPPAYDAQKDVYAAVQTLLSTAITNLSATAGAGTSITSDLFFAGNQTQWIAAAHSLKARFYLHTKNYTQALSEAKQGITAASNNMQMPYYGVVSMSANPYWDFLNNRTAYMDGVNSYAPALLLARNSGKTNETGRYKYFYYDGTPPTTYSTRDPNWINGAFQKNSYFPLITYTETQAIIAETSVRAGDAATALTSLNNIRVQDAAKYPTGTYTAYVSGDFAGNDALLKEIMTEKYLALIGQIEEFNDVRRTNNLIGVPINVSTTTVLPQRLLYPQVEINTNPNVPNPVPSLFTKTSVNQ